MDKLERYFTRTVEHIHRVQKNMVTLVTKFHYELDLSPSDRRKLMFNVMKHDQSKFNEIQFMPYVELTDYYHRRKVLGQKDYEYPTGVKEQVDIAVDNHYKEENHHMEKGDFKDRFEAIEIVCDLQAMAQEFNEGTCRKYYEEVWKPKYSKENPDDFRYWSVIDQMEIAIRCFEKLEASTKRTVNVQGVSMSDLKAMLSRIIRDGGNFVSRDKAAECLREFTDLEAKLAIARQLFEEIELNESGRHSGDVAQEALKKIGGA